MMFQMPWEHPSALGTITIKQAILIAMVFYPKGAYLAGGEVADTIKVALLIRHNSPIALISWYWNDGISLCCRNVANYCN